MVATVAIDGAVQEAHPDELLIELLERMGRTIPHVCYHPQLGPVQTCETCIVEANGRLVRACATRVTDGMTVSTKSAKASAPQVEAFDRILKAIPEGLAHATVEPEKPIGLFGLLRRLLTKDSLRGLASATDFLQAFGRRLHSMERPKSQS